MAEHDELFILTRVQVACRDLARVPHIVHLIHQFTENISQVALLNVLKDQNFHLLPQVLHAVDESSNMLYEEKLRQYRLAMYLVSSNMTLKEGKLNLMTELYRRYPGVVDDTTVRYIVRDQELSVLKWLYSCKRTLFKSFSEIIFAGVSRSGAHDIVEWIVELYPDTVWSLVYAAQGGHLKLLKWLVMYAKWNQNLVGTAWLEAMERGHLDVAKFLYELKPSTVQVHHLRIESLEMLQWIHDINHWDFDYMVVINAARAGRLEILQWLHIHHPNQFTHHAMDRAAENGHIEVLKFLHHNREDGCTTEAMNSAAKNGFLDGIECPSRHKATSSFDLLTLAAGNGHLNVVQWLHENRSEGCTSAAMDSAAKRGNWDILKWLHDNRNEGCTSHAMETKDPYIVHWLHENLGQPLPDNF
ncbi:Hypothetical protein PHPALM_8237, partial [Phytophthora palmivora]